MNYRTMIAEAEGKMRIHELILMAAIVLFGVSEAVADDTAPRTIHFPEEQSLGRLFFWDHKDNIFGYSSLREGDEQDDDEIAAQGDQVVPMGRSTGLVYYPTPNPTKTLDLRPLDQLEADDLNAIATPFIKVNATEVARLKRHTALEWISLGPLSRVDDSCLKPLADMVWLRALEVPETSVTDQGLSHLKGLTKLQKLDVYGTKISDEGLAHLAQMTDLRSLQLGNTAITDAAFRHLAPLTKLESLQLVRTKITGARLSFLEHCRLLKSLDLTQTGVTDDAVTALKPLGELRWLSLYHTNISDDSIPLLIGFKKLTGLNVGHTQVTKAGAQRIRESLPKCRVKHDDELIQE